MNLKKVESLFEATEKVLFSTKSQRSNAGLKGVIFKKLILFQWPPLFNELFNLNDLIKDATKYIEDILLESDVNFLCEYVTDQTCLYKELKVKYNRTHLLINKLGSMPSFRLEFYLYEYGCETPKYTYEVEYNSSGEFLDEYFLEY